MVHLQKSPRAKCLIPRVVSFSLTDQMAMLKPDWECSCVGDDNGVYQY
jgi:hypothetical protein